MTFMTPKAALPVPFNVFYYPARFLWMSRNICRAEKQMHRNTERRKQYIDLLDRLFNSKMHFEYEDSVQDDFNDLKIDVKNMIDSRHSDMMKKMENLVNKIDTLESKFRK